MRRVKLGFVSLWACPKSCQQPTSRWVVFIAMVTRRKWKELYTESKRVVLDEDGEPVVKQVTCCCAVAAGTRHECSEAAGNKAPCRCWCHSDKISN